MNLHYLIMRHFVEKGRAPSFAELRDETGLPEAGLKQKLDRLSAEHGVVLHPKCHEVWIAHPFATAPTGWWVEKGPKGWFGNCIWCSLGIAALIGPPATIYATFGGEKNRAVVEVGARGISPKNLVAHFSVPMRRAWDNVLFSCQTMHVFEDETAAKSWCRRHGFAYGEILPLDKVWQLAKLWYGRHLDRDWKKWSLKEAGEIFEKAGLTGDFWSVGDPGGKENF